MNKNGSTIKTLVNQLIRGERHKSVDYLEKTSLVRKKGE